jgi:hypothetical protein
MRKDSLRALVLFVVVASTLVAQSSPEADPLSVLYDLSSGLAVENPQAGGTIRAKSDPDNAKAAEAVRKDKARLMTAIILEARKSKMGELAVLRVRVISAALKVPFKGGVSKDEETWIIPSFKIKDGRYDLQDPLTRIILEIGTLKPGDTILVRLVKPARIGYLADYIGKK